ncbi:IS91 family transposase, partial [Moritella viscosa]|uniref:IS91 family transposase n=1 Tax=Moritella viscosa TaxID=80854 RepID=UPI000AB73A02
TFIDLLRIHHGEFERQFGNQLSHESRRAIYAMLSCKTRNQWHKGKNNYLYNAFALAKVWRARMIDAINQHADLSLANTDTLPTKWVVDCRKVGYGLPALQYLSRYLYRGVLPDKDIIDTSNNTVTFRYKDGQTQATKTRALPTLQFLWLILQHGLPKGLQRVRDYGFLHGNAKRLRVRIQVILRIGLIGVCLSSLQRAQQKQSVFVLAVSMK